MRANLRSAAESEASREALLWPAECNGEGDFVQIGCPCSS